MYDFCAKNFNIVLTFINYYGNILLVPKKTRLKLD